MELKSSKQKPVDSESSEDRPWFIYYLMDPLDGQVKYVGFTYDCEKRYRAHIKEAMANKSKTRKNNWIRHLRENGSAPLIFVLRVGFGDGWQAAEREEIALFRRVGSPLTNATDGGDGAVGYHATPEQRQAMSERRKGNKYALGFQHSEETRLRMSESHRGNKNRLGKRHDESSRAKMREKRKGKKPALGMRHSEETRAFLAEFLRQQSELRRQLKFKDQIDLDFAGERP